jgi:hypothetical protein
MLPPFFLAAPPAGLWFQTTLADPGCSFPAAVIGPAEDRSRTKV